MLQQKFIFMYLNDLTSYLWRKLNHTTFNHEMMIGIIECLSYIFHGSSLYVTS